MQYPEDKLQRLEHTFNEKLQALERTYNLRVHTLEKTYDEKLQALERTYNLRVHTLEKTYDEKLSSLERIYGEKIGKLYVKCDEKLRQLYEIYRSENTSFEYISSRYREELRDLEAKYDEKLQRVYQIYRDENTNFEYIKTRYKSKLRDLEFRSDKIESMLQTVTPLIGSHAISLRKIHDRLDGPPQTDDTNGYSRLSKIPLVLTDGEEKFTRIKCCEAVYEKYGQRIVFNYCEWFYHRMATSFHIHVCFEDKTVKSGVYIDSLQGNIIKPRTIFYHFVKKHDLVVTGDPLIDLKFDTVDVQASFVKMEIPESDATCLQIDHEVYFYQPVLYDNFVRSEIANLKSKKYWKRIRLHDGVYDMRFSDMKEAVTAMSISAEEADSIYISSQIRSRCTTIFMD